jgi:hypothetical protein
MDINNPENNEMRQYVIKLIFGRLLSYISQYHKDQKFIDNGNLMSRDATFTDDDKKYIKSSLDALKPKNLFDFMGCTIQKGSIFSSNKYVVNENFDKFDLYFQDDDLYIINVESLKDTIQNHPEYVVESVSYGGLTSNIYLLKNIQKIKVNFSLQPIMENVLSKYNTINGTNYPKGTNLTENPDSDIVYGFSVDEINSIRARLPNNNLKLDLNKLAKNFMIKKNIAIDVNEYIKNYVDSMKKSGGKTRRRRNKRKSNKRRKYKIIK